MSKCNLCPRKCNVDRNEQKGFCGIGEKIKVARAALHLWEEPCISGEIGSGTVFFSGCQLKCVYCQNKEISHGATGKEISVDRLCEIFFELASKGANNINLVTPDHFANGIAKALEKAKKNGLDIPIVYNCGGYSNVETLKMLDGLIDVYMPDFKYFDDTLGKLYSAVSDYCEVTQMAIAEMYAQTGKPVFKNGLMKKGIIVRQLVLPSNTKNSIDIIKYLYDTYGDDIFISIMSQFTPMGLENYPEINRRVTSREYKKVVDFAIDYGVNNAFIQQGKAAGVSFIPDFSSFDGV